MFILGTICCRGGSKGVKGKNIRVLHGKPLLDYTVEEALKCSLLNDLILSTDSAEIMSVAEEAGIKYFVKRPPELATDTASKWLVFIHAIEKYEEDKRKQVD